MKNGWRDGECAGVGCASQLMQNRLELGQGAGRGSQRDCIVRSVILMSPPAMCNVHTLKEATPFFCNPPHAKIDTLYSLGCPLQLFLGFFLALQGSHLSIGQKQKIRLTCQYAHRYIYFTYCFFSILTLSPMKAQLMKGNSIDAWLNKLLP